MENRKLLRILTALLMLIFTGMMLQAQTTEESQAREKYEKQMQEKEMQIKQMEMQLKKQQLEQEKKMVELERQHARQARAISRSSSGSGERSYVYAVPQSGDEPSYLIHSYGLGSQTQLTLRNSFDGESVSSDGEFEVDEGISQIRFTANGKVRKGEINIKVLYPGGKVFKDLNINSSAQITFSQSLTIKEEEKKKYVGTWKYEIQTKTAEGSYMLSIMTN